MNTSSATTPTPPQNRSDRKLSSSTRKSDYLRLQTASDREAIAKFFVERLTERFITPIESIPASSKHGFAVMALSCLLVETLESFWLGREKTPKYQGAPTFRQFFTRIACFHELIPQAEQFYEHIRCGILHQGETTGKWTVVRNGPLFDPAGPTINATKFHRGLKQEIKDYAALLSAEPWDGERWENFRAKMKFICDKS